MNIDSKKEIIKQHLFYVGMDLYDCYFRPDESLKDFLNSKFRKGKYGFKTIRHILYDFKTDQLKLEKQYKYFIKEVVIENEELKLACKEFYERVIGEKKMKKETKELVKWIKEQLDFIKNEANKCELRGAWYFDQFNKAVDFLNSIPEIENHLCRGGYIQDRNGTPCCDSELVYFLSKSKKETYGYLIWDKKNGKVCN